MATRSYKSPQRDEARDQTKQRIFDATVELVLTQGVHAFTMQNVAAMAGVAHRTVYRHFATREALLQGLANELEHDTRDVAPSVPPVSEWETVVARSFDALAKNSDRIQAIHAASVALRFPLQHRNERSKQFRRRLSDAFPNLGRAQCAIYANLIRNIISSSNWVSLTVEHGMTPASAKQGAVWAVRTLLADLSLRNETSEASQ